MKEYIDDEKEFLNVVEGRTHWHIKTEPVIAADANGNRRISTGEIRPILEVSGKAKEGHLVLFCLSFGMYFPKSNEYTEAVEDIHEYVDLNFPKATKGRWKL